MIDASLHVININLYVLSFQHLEVCDVRHHMLEKIVQLLVALLELLESISDGVVHVAPDIFPRRRAGLATYAELRGGWWRSFLGRWGAEEQRGNRGQRVTHLSKEHKA